MAEMIIPHIQADCKGFCIFCGKISADFLPGEWPKHMHFFGIICVCLRKVVAFTMRIYGFAKKFDKHLTFGGIVCIMNKYDYGSMIDVEALL